MIKLMTIETLETILLVMNEIKNPTTDSNFQKLKAKTSLEVIGIAWRFVTRDHELRTTTYERLVRQQILNLKAKKENIYA
jgi:hypothetical protein